MYSVGSSTVLIVLLTYLASGARLDPDWPRMPHPLWPEPRIARFGNTTLSLAPTFAFKCGSGPCSRIKSLEAAFRRYQGLIYGAGPASDDSAHGPVLRGVTVHCGLSPLAFGVDESYTLRVDAPTARVDAKTQWGALRALETLSQLVAWRGEGDAGAGRTHYRVHGSPVVVADAPRFPWRGLLLDTARHFLPVPAIERILDAMAAAKMNVLHWHLTDDQSFPLDVPQLHGFADRAALSPRAVYSHRDVSHLVGFARGRGIRIVPEIDMPGHAASWGRAYPSLVTQCKGGPTLLNPVGQWPPAWAGAKHRGGDSGPHGSVQDGLGPLAGQESSKRRRRGRPSAQPQPDPHSLAAKNYSTYDVFAQVLALYASAFEDSFLHLGGDEAGDYACWEADAGVKRWAGQRGLDSMRDVRKYFEATVGAIARAADRRSIVWEETLSEDAMPGNDTVVNTWRTPESVQSALEAGREVVSNYGWYLDWQAPPGEQHLLFEDTWLNFYAVEPVPEGATAAKARLVLGGEASMWGEQVDAANMESRIWPRAAAAAERLWSPASVQDIPSATARLDYHRCRLVRRGVRAAAIKPAGEFGYCEVPSSVPFA